MTNATIQVLPSGQAQETDFPWGRLTWYASGPLGNSTELTVGRCLLKPGERNPRHFHPNCSEILVVMQGTIRHTGAKGEDVEMRAGDTVAIPPNVPHQAVNVGDADALLFIVFSSADRQTIGE